MANHTAVPSAAGPRYPSKGDALPGGRATETSPSNSRAALPVPAPSPPRSTCQDVPPTTQPHPSQTIRTPKPAFSRPAVSNTRDNPAPRSIPQTVRGPLWARNPATKAQNVRKLGAVKHDSNAASRQTSEAGRSGLGASADLHDRVTALRMLPLLPPLVDQPRDLRRVASPRPATPARPGPPAHAPTGTSGSLHPAQPSPNQPILKSAKLKIFRILDIVRNSVSQSLASACSSRRVHAPSCRSVLEVMVVPGHEVDGERSKNRLHPRLVTCPR